MKKNIKDNLVTVCLFAYNQENYVKEAVLSILSQTYSSLEIILSDDNSSDNTFAIMKEMAEEYKGPHKIVLNKNKTNLGLINHFNKIVELASGDIIVVAAGDDVSMPSRVEKIKNIFNDKRIMSVASNFKYIDKQGNFINKSTRNEEGVYTLKDYLDKNYFPILGCTRAYRKEVFTFFGTLNKNCGVEDATSVFRSLLLGEIFTIKESLIKYRIGLNSLSKDINVDFLNNVIDQRNNDVLVAQKKGKISPEMFVKLIETFKIAKKKNEYIKEFNKNKSIMFFLKNIYLNSNFSKVDKRSMLKNLIKNKIQG